MDAKAIEAERARLDRELENDLKVVRDAHQVKLRSLRVLAMHSGIDLDQLELVAAPVSEDRRGRESVNGHGETITDRVKREIVAVLPRLPSKITRADIDEHVGGEVSRGTMLRALKQLENEGILEVAQKSAGRRPAVYKRGASVS